MQPTIHHGMVTFQDRPKEISKEDIETSLDMLRFFEWHGRISYLVEDGTCEMFLSVCPICNGLNPRDSHAALPKLRDLYNRSSGHHPSCKLNRMILEMSGLPALEAK